MDRRRFYDELTKNLTYQVKPSEIQVIIDYYDEMILDMMESGLSEEAAIQQLGDPAMLARQAINEKFEETQPENPLPAVQPYVKPHHPFHIFWVVLLVLSFPLWGSMGLAGFCIVASVYLIVLCIPLTSGIIGVSLVLAGAAASVLSIFTLQDGFINFLGQLGVGMMMIGLGLFSSLATYYFAIYFGKFHRGLFRLVARFVSRGRGGIPLEN